MSLSVLNTVYFPEDCFIFLSENEELEKIHAVNDIFLTQF